MYQITFVNNAGCEMVDRIVFQTKEKAVEYAESCGWFFKDKAGKLWQMVLKVID